MKWHEFICTCGWKWFVGPKLIIGPVFPNGDAPAIHIMNKETWALDYADCARTYDMNVLGYE
jgi:hypothetical protein